MTGLLLAEFADEKRFVAAARRAQSNRYHLVEAYSPFPVEDVLELLEHRRSHIRVAMLIGGFAMAALAYGLEFYSAVFNYPYNSGGRPFDSWPTFVLFPFATGILVAAVAGFTMFLVECGLPRLHDPLFAVAGFERASQDSFVLALRRPDDADDRRQMINVLHGAGAAAIREVPS